MKITDDIIPLPKGTTSGGKPADGLFPCPNECGEVAVVRITKTGEVVAYCDGRVRMEKCRGRHYFGEFRDFPTRDIATAKERATTMELSTAPREFINLFNNSWNIGEKDHEETQQQNKAGSEEDSTEEVGEVSIEESGEASTEEVGAETGENSGNSGNTEHKTSAGNPANTADNSESGAENAGIRKPTTEEIYIDLYGG